MSDTPQEPANVGRDILDAHSKALATAYQRGRLAGREEAAKHLEAVASHWDAEDDLDYAAAMRMAARFVRGESHTLPQKGG